MLTTQTASYLNDAYAYFNTHLFANVLPTPLITISRKKRALGYFSFQAFNKNGVLTDEIALTPLSLSRSSMESLSTLVHEQCHAWQYHYGKPGKNGYHNRQWANKMLEVGLWPFCITNKTLMTGYKCSHTIADEGLFKKVAEKFLYYRGEIQVTTQYSVSSSTRPVKQRPLLICPNCKKSFTVPFNSNVTVVCNDCDEEMIDDLTNKR